MAEPVTASRRAPVPRDTVFVVSRCAWTLFNFRRSLIKAVGAGGSKVVALGAAGDGYESKLRADAVDFRPIPVSRRGLAPLADLLLLVRLIALFRRERPSVVHAFTIKPAIFGTVAAWICRVPVRVVTITGLGYSFTSAAPWLRSIVEGLYRFALARASFVYFQNETDRDLFVRSGLVRHAVPTGIVRGSGVDLERFYPTPLPAIHDRKPVRFLMVGRLIREKGVLEFVAAANIVKRKFPMAEFVILGGEDGRNPTALSRAELAPLKNDRSVEWLSEVVDVRPIIASADVVVLPSYREGAPRALLEGGAMGRAAIATDTVGCRDVVVDGVTGYLVPVGDAVALAGAMQRFLESPSLLERMGRAAREHVVAEFDERHVIEETLAKYAELSLEPTTTRGNS